MPIPTSTYIISVISTDYVGELAWLHVAEE